MGKQDCRLENLILYVQFVLSLKDTYMPKSKITLTIDDRLLERVKKVSKTRGKSLSNITEDFYKKLSASGGQFSLSSELLGCAAGNFSKKSDKEIMEMYLEEKHG
jgi:hypothetical protein